MKKYRITEIICVVLAVIFIVFSAVSAGGTNKNAEDIVLNFLEFTEDSTLKDRGIEYVRKSFGAESDMFESFAYYTSDDIMDVNEVFVCVLADKSSAGILSNAIKKYVSDRYAVYNGYAKEQAELLDNYVLKVRGNAVLFCVSKNSQDILDSFMKSL